MRKILIGLLIVFSILSCLAPIYAKTKEEIYQEKLAELKPDDAKGHYELGVWCKRNKLSEQAQVQFRKTIELEPTHRDARRKLGHIKYKGQWTSSEEMEAKGLVKYKGRWIAYDKMMKAKGMVEFEGQWVTRKEKKQLEARARKMEVLAKQFPFKGVLGKPGADSENLSWEEARTKETEHFIIKTNLSVDALNDICFILECAYLNYQDIFGFGTPKEKLRVMVSKNEEEYQKISYDLTDNNPLPGEGGVFIPASGQRNKSRQNHLLSYYNLSQSVLLTAKLLHECTHYATELARQKYNCFQPPIWIYEGYATYYEASKLEGKRLARGSPEGLVTNVINQVRLPLIKDDLDKQTHIKLKDFINLSSKEYSTVSHYDQGWSLIYFLLNGQGGKYKAGLQAYMEAWKKGKIVMGDDGVSNYYPQDKSAHLKLFEECMSTSIDQLEQEWKEYILQLK